MLGSLKLGNEKDGIAGNENVGRTNVGSPGRAGSAGNENDGRAKEGIAGNENVGRTRTGKQQLLIN